MRYFPRGIEYEYRSDYFIVTLYIGFYVETSLTNFITTTFFQLLHEKLDLLDSISLLLIVGIKGSSIDTRDFRHSEG